jgi:parallel beta helix pectate lyase-like protein
MPRLRARLRFEELEARRLLSNNAIHIDSNWVRLVGGNPIVLTQANTEYVLETNVDVPGTAFVIGAPNITLDLNGHTVTYGDLPPIQVNNGGFELAGTGGGLPGWDLSRAPTASRVPAVLGMYGQWMLQMSNFNTTQTILSDPVAIPQANREYSAAITPKGFNVTVNLTVLDAVTGAVLGRGTSRSPDRGFAAVAIFTPVSTDPVRLQIDAVPNAGTTTTVDLDYASVQPSRDYGVFASQVWLGQGPLQLQTSAILAVYRNAAKFTLQNGQVVQGQGHGSSSSPLYFQGLPGFTVNRVTSVANGMDTSNLDATWGSNAVVTNSTFQAAIDRVSDRMDLVSAILLERFNGTATVTGNRIANVPQVGILFNGDQYEQSVTIANNDIRQKAIVTDGYGILVAGARNFNIASNTVIPVQGRGILFDGWGGIVTENGTVTNNYVDAFEAPNLEYGDQLNVTALRIRNWGNTFRHLTFSHNTFMAHTGPGGVYDADGATISQWNDQGQETGANNVFTDNIFKGIVDTANSYYKAQGLVISEVGAGTGLQITGNVLESNDTSLQFGDADSWMQTDTDIAMGGNTLRLSTIGAARPFTSILAGNYQTTVTNIQMPNTYLENGAPAVIAYGGGPVSNLNVDWQTGPPPGGDSTGGTGAGGSGAGHAVFVIGLDSQVWCETCDGNGQGTSWTLTGPGLVQAISSYTDAGGTAQVFAIGLDGQVWQESSTGTASWGAWTLTHPGVVKALALFVDGSGNTSIFAVGLDNQVWVETSAPGGPWGAWTLTQPGAVTGVSVTADPNGQPQVFAIGLDSQVWDETVNGRGGWNPWTLFQPGAVKGLSVVADNLGHPGVFAIGLDDQVWSALADAAGRYSGWALTQARQVKALTVLSDASGHGDIFAVSTDSQVWDEMASGPGQWTGWTLSQAGAVLQLAH